MSLKYNPTMTRIHGLLSALLLSTLVLGGCKRGASAAETAAAAKANSELVVGPENIAVVKKGAVTTGPALSGSLAPEREATLRAQSSGSVLETYAEQGQTVASGTLLVRLDATSLQDAFLSARSAVASARGAADIARRDLARSRTLLAAGAIAQRDLETSQRASIAAEAALADAQSRLAVAQKNISNTRIVAPFNGIVSARSVSAGDVVQPGTALYTVVDPSSMRLEASLPAEQVSEVKVGTPVSFSVNGYPDRLFEGRITRVSPTADPATRQVQVIVSIPNAGRTLVGGLFADGRVSSRTRYGIVAPMSAIESTMATPTVLRLRGGRAERVPVTVGIRDANDQTVEITAGLAAGDTLLTAAAQAISPGTRVRLAAPPSDEATTIAPGN